MDALTEQLTRDKGEDGNLPVRLLRAKKQLDKAVAARAALEEEIDTIQKQCEERLTKLGAKFQ